MLLAASLDAQSLPPQFDVASVKPNDSGDYRMRASFQPGGRFVAVNAPVVMLLLQAYRIPDRRMVGLPAWARAARFDVNARAASGDATPDDLRRMTQALLAEHFKLAAHLETRDDRGFALVREKADAPPGPQLRKASAECEAYAAAERARQSPATPEPGAAAPPCATRPGMGTIASGAITMPLLALSLSFELNATVVDETGLAGDYQVSLAFAPEARAGLPPPPAAASDDRVSIFTAVQEQLGLKLVPRTSKAEYLVIDRIERPRKE